MQAKSLLRVRYLTLPYRDLVVFAVRVVERVLRVEKFKLLTLIVSSLVQSEVSYRILIESHFVRVLYFFATSMSPTSSLEICYLYFIYLETRSNLCSLWRAVLQPTSNPLAPQTSTFQPSASPTRSAVIP